MRNVLVSLVLVVLGCGPMEADDMALKHIPVSWSITGGLDTSKSPLSVQPGAVLRADNVIQERLNEWRKRNGFTQSALDTLPETGPYFVGRLGDAGMFEDGQSGLSAYSPSLSSGRWGTPVVSAPPQHRSRKPLFETPGDDVGFARSGDMLAVAFAADDPAGGTQTLTVRSVDAKTGVPIATATKTIAISGITGRIRGAAVGGKLLIVIADNAASFGANGIWTYVIDASTGAIAGPTLIKALAIPAAADVRYYGGSTVTIVAAYAGPLVRHVEFDPATMTISTDVNLAGVTLTTSLNLLDDADASGTRGLIGSQGIGPQTHVVRMDALGNVLSDDIVDAYTVRPGATGVLSNGGADWNVVYQDANTKAIRTRNKTGGVLGASLAFQGATWDTASRIDTQAWRDPSINGWFFVLGVHSQSSSDPIDCWIEMFMPLGASAAFGIPVSAPVQLAASGLNVHSPFQVVRTGSRKFSTVLPVGVVYENNAGVIVRHFSLDLFEQTYLTSADDAGTLTQRPVRYKQTSFVPAGFLSFVDGGVLRPIGTATPPRQVAVTPSVGAGALTLLAEYGVVAVVETIDSDGNIWRSPQSVPRRFTLTGGQNTATYTFSTWAIDPSYFVRVSLYRSAANGSSYRRIYSTLAKPGPDIVYVDLLADTAIVNGQVLYTEGELETALTPPASVAWLHDDRLWAANREYGTELWYTKNLRPGRQPEFTDVGLVDIDDEFGDITNGASLDTQNVVFKRNAIYFGVGDGYTDSGSGSNYHFDRIDGDEGSIPGSPIVNTGNAIYFVSERGIRIVDKQGSVTPVDALDQFLNQPLVQARETVLDGCFVNQRNEVVFLTTNYILIQSLKFGYWRRIPSLPGMRRCLVINGQLVLIRNDGTTWREGDETQTTDQGAAYEGELRSPWMRPTDAGTGPGSGSSPTVSQQGLRVYRGRVSYTRTGGGADVLLKGRIYRNNDDAQVEEFLSNAIGPTALSGDGEMVPKESKCKSFALGLVLPSSDVTLRVDGFSATIGIRGGPQAVEKGSRWKS